MLRKHEDHPFQPDWVSAPGETIQDIMEERDMTVAGVAHMLRRDDQFVRDLLVGKTRIDSDLAAELDRVLGGTKDFWINRDSQFVENSKRLGIELPK